MKSSIILLAFALSGKVLCVAPSESSSDVIKVEFTINGVPKPCSGMQIEIRLAGELVPVAIVDGGFVAPQIFNTLYNSAATRDTNNIHIHVECSGYPFDFANEYPSRLLPGTWSLGVSYPDSWFNSSSRESRGSAVGEWLTFINWECNICEPVAAETQAHSEIPSDVSERLQREQPNAVGERAMEIAFALAVFAVDHEKNRDYLLSLFAACLASPSKPAIEGICDHTRIASLLANLYERGDERLLCPLLEASESQAYAAEELSYFYADSLENRQGELLLGLADLPIANQEKVCAEAQQDDLSIDSPKRDRVLTQLRANGSDVAIRCLHAIQDRKTTADPSLTTPLLHPKEQRPLLGAPEG